MKKTFSELVERANDGLHEKEVWISSCKEITLLGGLTGIIIKSLDSVQNNSMVLNLGVKYELQAKPKTFEEVLKRVKEKSDIELTIKHELLDTCVSVRDDFELKKLKNKVPMFFDETINTLENQFASDDLAQILLEGEWFIEE